MNEESKFIYLVRKDKFNYIWIIMTILLIIGFIIIANVKYDKSSNYVGIANNNNIEFLVEEKILPNLPDNIYINNIKYQYEIVELSSDYYLENNIRYHSLKIRSAYENNGSINVKFIFGKTSLFEEIKRII